VQFGLTFTERFLSEFVSGEVEYPEPSPDFDLYTRKAVAAADVLKIIEFSDPAFEELTRCSTWSGHEQITPEEE
jgi:hypothetical protein